MKTLITLLMICICAIGCSQESLIKKDLNNRFVKYEIVLIKPEKSYVNGINTEYAYLKYLISKIMLECTQAEAGFLKIEGHKQMTFNEVNDIYKNGIRKISSADSVFQYKQFNKSQDCYHVSFLIYDGAIKVPKEELYFERHYSNGTEVEMLHRSYNWDDYLIEINYNNEVKLKLKELTNRWKEFILN